MLQFALVIRANDIAHANRKLEPFGGADDNAQADGASKDGRRSAS